MSERDAGATITLHSTWRGIVSGSIGGVTLAAAGTYGVVAVGFRLVPGLLFVAGWILVAAMTFDYPIAARFSAEGVQRRMMLRRQWFAWSDVEQLTGTRPTVLHVDRRLEHGGLALVKGKRRYLLVDRVESMKEFDTLIDIVEGPGATVDVGVSSLPRPSELVPPTWMHRRRHWRPDGSTVR